MAAKMDKLQLLVSYAFILVTVLLIGFMFFVLPSLLVFKVGI